MTFWKRKNYANSRTSLIAQSVRSLPEMQETWVQFLVWEDPLEKEMSTHYSILAWRIPWTEEPGRLQSTGGAKSRTQWATSLSLSPPKVTLFGNEVILAGASLVAQKVKRLPEMQETWVQSLGQEDPLEKEIATHSSTLAWKIPCTEKPGRLQFMGSQRVGHDWVTSLTYEDTCSLEKKALINLDSLLKSRNIRCPSADEWIRESCGTYTQWSITQPLKRIHLNQF